ncbi:unnamed protein product [Ectocarpus fasciculatus]
MFRLDTWWTTVGEATTYGWNFEVVNAASSFLYFFDYGQFGSDPYGTTLQGGAGAAVMATVTAGDAAGNTDSCSFLMVLWPRGTPLPTEEPAPTPQPTDEPSYLGCFSDPAENRVFEWQSSSSSMTADVCSGLCSGSDFYGTQYSTECWCGESANYDANGASDECVMPCAGDASQMCGGSYTMSVYKNDVDPSYRGCYSDPADSRVFVQDVSSDEMTNDLCAMQCADWAFYGTQYSSECWCGDINAPYSVNGEGECDMTCSGNSEETCGGSYSMNVYAQDPAYLGCFSDPAESRMFLSESSTSAMTAEVCALLCTGSAYYGTQYSQECWCGDNADYAANGFGVCDMPCTGNSDEMCGGPYTMSVYQTL